MLETNLFIWLNVLHATSATRAKMRTNRFDSVWIWITDQLNSVGFL